MVETGAHIDRGSVSPDSLTARAWSLARVCHSAHRQAADAAQWAEKRKRELLERAAGGT
jgi:hypothetical protein